MKIGQSPCTIVQGIFGATLKIFLKSKFDWNQLKLSTQHTSTCICIRKNYKYGEVIFAKIWPMTLYYSIGTLC